MKNVEVDFAGRRYRVCFLNDSPDSRVMVIGRKLAGGGESAIDIHGVTGRGVVSAAKSMMRKNP